MSSNKIKQTKSLREIWYNRLCELRVFAEQALNDAGVRTEFKIRYLDINDIAKQFQNRHSLLIEYLSTVEGSDLGLEDEVRKDFDNIFYKIKEIYTNLFTAVDADSSFNQNNNQPSVKLPKIELPKFDGTLKYWPSFYDRFKSLIHDNIKLTDSEKFQYLLSCLSKDPLSIAKALPLTADNYPIAFKSLIDRYQNVRLLASTYWYSIVDAPKINFESAPTLRRLLNIFSENLDALRNLGLPVDSWSFVLFHILIKKLDSGTVKRFELQYNSTAIPTYTDLITFLSKQCIALESVAISSQGKISIVKKPMNSYNTNSPQNNFVNNASCLVNTTHNSKPLLCVLCSKPHALYRCSVFISKTPLERYNLAKDKNLCLNCLNFGHRTVSCTSPITCRTCHYNHHSLLHFSRNISTSESPMTSGTNPTVIARVNDETTDNVGTGSPIDCPSTSQTVTTLTNIVPISTVLLSTAIVEILDSRGHFQKVRALVDSASQASFITSTCCNRLGLPRSRLSLTINGLGDMSSEANSVVCCTLRSRNDSRQNILLEAIVLPKICNLMPSTYIPKYDWPHLANLPLADPNFNVPNQIDMLLGADIFPSLMIGGQIQGDKNQPSAFETIFGWVLIGKISNEHSSVNSFCVSHISPLDSIMKKCWELEEVPQISSPLSSEDELCEKIFVDNFSRDENGRFSVVLPFKNGEPNLLETRSIALRRFNLLENRLIRDSKLYESYSSFIGDYLESKHMDVALSPPRDITKCFYLPHHCVIKPDSPSTKLRVVFDASLRPHGGESLNDTLLVGPKLQKDLSEILLHFRLHRFVFTADIRQMYRQILIKPDHRDYQRILWRFSPQEPIREYVLNTVTFGVSSAPFLAIRTLLQLAKEEEHNFPRASSILNSNLYVDDIVTGCNTLNDALSLQGELIDLLKKGCFELRKWSSNHSLLLESIPVDFRHEKSLSFSNDENSIVKILGLKWSPTSDAFSFDVDVQERPCTKRTILSDLARIFDPIGFLSPVTFLAKYLMQHLWTLGLHWDQQPPEDFVSYWKRFKGDLPVLSSLKIPRWYNLDSNQSCQIHAFCDSSERGFSSVVYFRIIDFIGNVNTVFVTAKSKVAPLKKVSLPRLELLAAVLLSNLVDFVFRTYREKIEISQVFAWSDSSVALSWIKSPSYRWKTFVSNRVSFIQDRIPPSSWNHVRSSDNPADCGSRGILASDLVNHSLWWNGPPWLKRPPEEWPKSSISFYSESSAFTSEEERKVVLSATVSIESLDILIEKFSSLQKIVRIVAYCRRFIALTKRSFNKSTFTLSLDQYELDKSLICLVKRVQSVHFSKEIASFDKNNSLPKWFRKLSPFVDEEGLVRVGGRLINSQISYDQKHPILLPRDHRLTDLIIQDTHRRYLHPGLQTLRYLILQRFWIVNAKRAIRSVLSKCLRCYRLRPKNLTPYMGNLPSPRVTQVKPFSCVGVDFGGPFFVTSGRGRGVKSQKAYLCLFICFATRAVHLEIASDLSSEAFLAALRRFISRRGRCSIIYSDQGTNFIGANKYLVDLFKTATDVEHIEWRFNPPSAPHFGGLWEAGIKSVKTHLTKVIGDQVLTFEELYTVFVQIEALLNSRPLTELSSDTNDLNALTPGHFLTLEPLTVLPDRDLSHLKLNTLNRWQLLQRLHQSFWKRWHFEYLNTLNQRHKWNKAQPELNIGKLVLIKDELQPPLRWRLGRIIKTHPGSDGICRVVTVKTAKGEIVRPLVKICPLPFN